MTIEEVIADNAKAMSFEPKTVNYPINLGFSDPWPAGFFEFAIIGVQDQKKEAVPKIMKLFETNLAPIVSITFSSSESFDQFIMNIVCDLNGAKCSPEDLLIRINKSKSVKVAEISPLEGKAFGKFSFPLTFFGEIRALAIDSDRFVHLLDEITKVSGSKGKDALFQNGRIEGKEIIAALKQKLGEKARDRQFLFENARGLFQTAGWGKLYFYAEGAELYKVTVNDPPSDAEGGTITGNYFLHGLIAGILEPFLKNGIRLSMIREAYEAEKKDLVLYYMDRIAIKKLAPQVEAEEKQPKTRREITTAVAKPRATEEAALQVRQIIKSIDKISEEKKTKSKFETEPVLLSESKSSEGGEETQPKRAVQGGSLFGGGGIQIIQQVDKPPLPQRKKKIVSLSEDDLEYSSNPSEQF
jgi:hypothetical protein